MNASLALVSDQTRLGARCGILARVKGRGSLGVLDNRSVNMGRLPCPGQVQREK